MIDPRQARELAERHRDRRPGGRGRQRARIHARPVTLDLERLHAIAAQCPVPLVLHGASGLPLEQLRGADLWCCQEGRRRTSPRLPRRSRTLIAEGDANADAVAGRPTRAVAGADRRFRQSLLRLDHHRSGGLLRLDEYLYRRHSGMIDSLSQLVRGAAILAIEDRSDRSVDSCSTASRSLRRRTRRYCVRPPRRGSRAIRRQSG